MPKPIELRQVVLIVVVVVIIFLTLAFIEDKPIQQGVLNACTEYIKRSNDLPSSYKKNIIVDKCIDILKSPLHNDGVEGFGYSFDLYGGDYQYSPNIQGKTLLPLQDL